MKRLTLGCLGMVLAASSGWAAMSLADHRRQSMAQEGDAYEVYNVYPSGPDRIVGNGPSIPSQGVAGSAATVGELRKLGYEVRLSKDGEYELVQPDGTVRTTEEEIQAAINDVQRDKAQALRMAMTKEGDEHRIVSRFTGRDGRTVSATVGELRTAGYNIGVTELGAYSMEDPSGNIWAGDHKTHLALVQFRQAERSKTLRGKIEKILAMEDKYLDFPFH